MSKYEILDSVLDQIKDPAVKIVAKHSLRIAKQALDIEKKSQVQYVVDETRKIFPKALKKRAENED